MNLKEIHIGEFIYHRMKELQISSERVTKFLKCTEADIEKMYQQSSLDTDLLLRWSKLLEYDFFRLYTGHLILYAPLKSVGNLVSQKNDFPVFRKNIYTEEVKSFILNKISTKKMTPQQVILKYRIPKTTLFKWMKKEL
ncbi:transposase [Chryseobacterium mulctrae]|uniref:transposase n=1 Tax=Chryseobacterium mulctrae TaxID=2576777 RepID=UPI00111718DA|nr:transposase [Chryseobacterium mulctrae]